MFDPTSLLLSLNRFRLLSALLGDPVWKRMPTIALAALLRGPRSTRSGLTSASVYLVIPIRSRLAVQTEPFRLLGVPFLPEADRSRSQSTEVASFLSILGPFLTFRLTRRPVPPEAVSLSLLGLHPFIPTKPPAYNRSVYSDYHFYLRPTKVSLSLLRSLSFHSY